MDKPSDTQQAPEEQARQLLADLASAIDRIDAFAMAHPGEIEERTGPLWFQSARILSIIDGVQRTCTEHRRQRLHMHTKALLEGKTK